MRRNDVSIDRRGWAQHLRYRRNRQGLPWTPVEDRAVLRRVAGADAIGYADPTVRSTALAHGRSPTAITARVHALRAGVRLVMAAKGPVAK